jgi:hypothetical protein
LEYKIVSWADDHEVEREVNNLLNKGWKLVGGLVFDGTCYSQAMSREY